MEANKKQRIYFFSDVHLGAPDYNSSLAREKKLVSFLCNIEGDATELFILGDLFDMWFDYKRVVPKGYVRILGQLAKMADSGIKIHYFIGNHDMWAFDYFEKEIGLTLYREPRAFIYNNKKILIGHGDGLGPGDHTYKLIKRIFAGKINQWMFARLHPNFALGLANKLSSKSRIANGNFEETMEDIEAESLLKYCREKLKHEHIDYFIFGHRHIAIDFDLGNNSKYINLGEWVKKPHYGLFDGQNLSLLKV